MESIVTTSETLTSTSSPKRLRVTRTIVIEGEADWVENTTARSLVNLDRPFILSIGSIKETKFTMEELKHDN